jgi:hypothetical protein
MTRIIAGMFANRATASAAVGELRIAGVKKGDIDAFVVPSARRRPVWRFGREQDNTDDDAAGREIGPFTGAAVGGAIGAVAGLVATQLMGPMAIAGGMAAGAYAGSLAGVMRSLGEPSDPDTTRSVIPRAGVMVAVHVALQENEDIAFDVLRHNGAHAIEWAEGAWRHGKWASFDPVAPPQRIVSLDRNRPPKRRARSRGDAPLAAPHEWHLARHHGHK